MIIRRLLTRTGVAVLAVSVALATAVPAQAAAPTERSDNPPAATFKVGVPKQIGSTADTRYCLTFVAAEKIPMAVMLPCAPKRAGKAQQWIWTAKGELQVALSKSVGGELAKTGACLDTAADLVPTPAEAPVLVLPCRDADGQKWTHDKDTGALVNVANGQALSSMIGKAKQARPTATEPADGSPAQAWRQLPIPNLDILGAIMALVNALLSALGLSLPLPIEKAAASLLELVGGKLPIPAQMQVLPKQMINLVR
ncbi:RICIN domain-containing protein [Kribbella sp. NBC_01245]|uniref:RICIN domain-containing protein n=1 Tax=Kribbella sp. NBC_01245 TaxID=2903578 RepID=UPI002E284683|nr:RICIN domain-containing protein [Kribbella sp. NBC_01245]